MGQPLPTNCRECSENRTPKIVLIVSPPGREKIKEVYCGDRIECLKRYERDYLDAIRRGYAV